MQGRSGVARQDQGRTDLQAEVGQPAGHSTPQQACQPGAAVPRCKGCADQPGAAWAGGHHVANQQHGLPAACGVPWGRVGVLGGWRRAGVAGGDGEPQACLVLCGTVQRMSGMSAQQGRPKSSSGKPGPGPAAVPPLPAAALHLLPAWPTEGEGVDHAAGRPEGDAAVPHLHVRRGGAEAGPEAGLERHPALQGRRQSACSSRGQARSTAAAYATLRRRHASPAMPCKRPEGPPLARLAQHNQGGAMRYPMA